ncbi:hypothetical protein ANN_15241 [Periplaneta americana]|uniref:Uncharacterized protein n=1 Tax=Periplaneta americana TaxID=6978 RepID=A0ABQ8SFU6_PERAM|nr:hypothetical protein ANN_15241 [Periplaneta americana]
MPRGRAWAAYRHLSNFVNGRIIGVRNRGEPFRQIAQIVGCSVMTAEQVVTRWTQDNSVARKAGTGPFRRTTP